MNNVVGAISKIQKTYLSLSITKKLVLWYTISTIIQNGILFLVTPLYTRLLTDLEYGIFSVYQSWQMLVSIIAVLALDRCITVGFMKFEHDRKGFLSSVQLLMTLTVTFFAFVAFIFSSNVEKLTGLPFYLIASMFVVALMNNAFANWMWFQRYNYSYKKLAIITTLFTAVIQIISILSVLSFPNANKGEILILASVIGRVLLYGILYVGVFSYGRVFYNFKYWIFALGYSIAVVPHALAQIILHSSDRIMIDKLCGRADAAYYSVTYTAVMALSVVMMSISSAIQPWFFEKIKQNDFQSISEKTNFFLLFCASLSIMASLLAPEVIAILAPASYSAAVWAFPSIAASVFFNGMYLCFANFESYYEKPFYFSIATVTGAVVNIFLNYICIPQFGFIAAGYTTLICYMIFSKMHYIFMRKVCREKLDGMQVFDIKFIVCLSIIVILLSLGVTVIYGVPLIRYFLISIGIIVLIIKRHFITKQIKSILVRK